MDSPAPGPAPRDPLHLRQGVTTQLLPQVLAALPIGYWQRRLGARAFGLDLMPPVPRASHAVRIRRLPGAPPIPVLVTDVMTWGWVPWIWHDDPRGPLRAPRAAVRRVIAAATTPQCAAVFVGEDRARLAAALPRLRLIRGVSRGAVVGAVTLEDLADLFEEAGRELGAARGGPAAQDAARQLRLLRADQPEAVGQ